MTTADIIEVHRDRNEAYAVWYSNVKDQYDHNTWETNTPFALDAVEERLGVRLADGYQEPWVHLDNADDLPRVWNWA